MLTLCQSEFVIEDGQVTGIGFVAYVTTDTSTDKHTAKLLQDQCIPWTDGKDGLINGQNAWNEPTVNGAKLNKSVTRCVQMLPVTIDMFLCAAALV